MRSLQKNIINLHLLVDSTRALHKGRKAKKSAIACAVTILLLNFAMLKMKRTTNIILSFILSLMIVWIGSGIMTVVCEHTGLVSVAHQTSKRHCNDADANHCMKLQMKTLSPTDMVPTGFHHLQPVLLSLLPQLVTHYDLLPLPVCARASWRMSHPPLHGSSRQYLRLLTSLLI